MSPSARAVNPLLLQHPSPIPRRRLEAILAAVFSAGSAGKCLRCHAVPQGYDESRSNSDYRQSCGAWQLQGGTRSTIGDEP